MTRTTQLKRLIRRAKKTYDEASHALLDGQNDPRHPLNLIWLLDEEPDPELDALVWWMQHPGRVRPGVLRRAAERLARP